MFTRFQMRVHVHRARVRVYVYIRVRVRSRERASSRVQKSFTAHAHVSRTLHCNNMITAGPG